jgi:hypothetical protein
MQLLRQGQHISRCKIALPHLHCAEAPCHSLLNKRNERTPAGLMTIRDEIERKINAGHGRSDE